MKLFLRILIGFYAVLGIAVGSIALGAWGFFISVMAGAGAGSGGDVGSDLFKVWGLGLAIWTIPTTAFFFMLMIAINRLKGILRHIGYWYSLIFSVVLTGALFLFSPGFNVPKWVGYLSLLMTILSAVVLRKPKIKANFSENISLQNE